MWLGHEEESNCRNGAARGEAYSNERVDDSDERLVVRHVETAHDRRPVVAPRNEPEDVPQNSRKRSICLEWGSDWTGHWWCVGNGLKWRSEGCGEFRQYGRGGRKNMSCDKWRWRACEIRNPLTSDSEWPPNWLVSESKTEKWRCLLKVQWKKYSIIKLQSAKLNSNFYLFSYYKDITFGNPSMAKRLK